MPFHIKFMYLLTFSLKLDIETDRILIFLNLLIRKLFLILILKNINFNLNKEDYLFFSIYKKYEF